MSYIFSGALRGRLGPGLTESIADATIKLYRLPRAGSDGARDGFGILTQEEERSKEYRLFAQGRSDEEGRFRIDLSGRSVVRPGIPVPYEGEAFEVDVFCREVPGRKGAERPEEVQFTLGTVEPDWSGGEVARDYELTQEQWGSVRERFDAWVACGRVVDRDGRGVPNVKVGAFDDDVLQDDALGNAVTDAEGRFRIDFSSREFNRTAVPAVRYETGTPELYFRVWAGGQTLLDEKTQPGGEPGRAPSGACYFVELVVDAPSVQMPPQS